MSRLLKSRGLRENSKKLMACAPEIQILRKVPNGTASIIPVIAKKSKKVNVT